MMVGKKEAGDTDIVQFSEGVHLNFGIPLMILAIVIAAGGTFLLWTLNKDVASKLSERQAERDKVIAQIASPAYAGVETKAADFKASVSELQKAIDDRYSMSEFLPELYKHITNDVKVGTIAISDDGNLSLDGETKSYRSVADFLMALGSWKSIKDLELVSVTTAMLESGQQQTTFAITAKIDKAVPLKEEVKKAVDSGSSDNTSEAADVSQTGSVEFDVEWASGN